MAQIGLLFPIARRVCQTIVVARATLMANRTPTRCSCVKSYRRISASTCRAPQVSSWSLIRLGGVALQLVDDSCFGGVQGDPVLSRVLQRDEERLEPLHRDR